VLERLLPLLSLEEANMHHGFVPVEVAGGGVCMKPPVGILDAQDFTVQEIFGISGDNVPALPRSSRLHFPVRTLTPNVRTQLRRLGMHGSMNNPTCLIFLTHELKSRNSTVPGERYGDLQRVLMQRILESWPNLRDDAKRALLSEAFVDISHGADGGEVQDSLFSLKPFRDRCVGRLLSLGELVSRTHDTDPYLCWTSVPLSPRGFPEFAGFRRTTVEDVIAHAKALGELPDNGVPWHLWPELKEKVVEPLCTFLAGQEPFRSALGENGEAQLEQASKSRISTQLRKTKFLAVPMDEAGTHTLVAPWRISLVLKSHRPPMFALPEYLQDHIPLLRLLGVRDALELPQSESANQGDNDAARAMEQSMEWLFTSGAETFADVTVRCDGGSLHVHRNILMARSEYFRAMFQGGEGGFREGQEGSAEVTMFEAPLDVARVLFRYLYSGRVDESPLEGPQGTSNSIELMCLAHQYMVPYLFEFAQSWVANQQDLEDCRHLGFSCSA